MMTEFNSVFHLAGILAPSASLSWLNLSHQLLLSVYSISISYCIIVYTQWQPRSASHELLNIRLQVMTWMVFRFAWWHQQNVNYFTCCVHTANALLITSLACLCDSRSSRMPLKECHMLNNTTREFWNALERICRGGGVFKMPQHLTYKVSKCPGH
jgi:hypothetical protein